MSEILEEFDGLVERVREGIAYLTLKSTTFGDILWGEYPYVELEKYGIREGQQFKLRTIQHGDEVKLEWKPIPFCVLTEERIREIREMTERMLPDD